MIKLTKEEIMHDIQDVFGEDKENENCYRAIKNHSCIDCEFFGECCSYGFEWLMNDYKIINKEKPKYAKK